VAGFTASFFDTLPDGIPPHQMCPETAEAPLCQRGVKTNAMAFRQARYHDTRIHQFLVLECKRGLFGSRAISLQLFGTETFLIADRPMIIGQEGRGFCHSPNRGRWLAKSATSPPGSLR